MALPPMSAERQALITIEGISDRWSVKQGGVKKATGTKVFDGGATSPEIVFANAEAEDLTIKRPFRPTRDTALIAGLMKQVNNWHTTIHVQYTDANLAPVGGPVTYAGWLSECNPPDADAKSGDAAMFELVFAIETVT